MAQDDKYMNLAINELKNLRKKYNLKLVVRDSVLKYTNTLFSFSVYLEKHFEFFVCFHLQQLDLRLYDIAVWLDFEKRDIDMLKRNQVANECEARYVLANLRSVLEKVLIILQREPDMLRKFYNHITHKKNNKLLCATLLAIQQAWEAKEYIKFLTLVESNRAEIKHSEKSLLIFKQEAYIRKLQEHKTGDGSPS